VYHQFPRGKNELVSEAIRLVGNRLLQALGQQGDQSLTESVGAFTAIWRQVLVGSDCQGGCAIAAVVIDAANQELSTLAAEAFRGWTQALAHQFKKGGLTAAQARRLATTVIAATEGALILSRAQGTLQPFDDVAAQLKELSLLLT
jgi:TetR/AcrR family transcriptional regulator, lmrAB and yxaGH operons repressor